MLNQGKTRRLWFIDIYVYIMEDKKLARFGTFTRLTQHVLSLNIFQSNYKQTVTSCN